MLAPRITVLRQLQQIVVSSSKAGLLLLAPMECEPQYALVELDLALQIGYGQVYMPHARGGVDYEVSVYHRSNRCSRLIGWLPYLGRRGKPIGAGGEDEVGLGEAIDAVGRDRDAGLAPA